MKVRSDAAHLRALAEEIGVRPQLVVPPTSSSRTPISSARKRRRAAAVGPASTIRASRQGVDLPRPHGRCARFEISLALDRTPAASRPRPPSCTRLRVGRKASTCAASAIGERSGASPRKEPLLRPHRHRGRRSQHGRQRQQRHPELPVSRDCGRRPSANVVLAAAKNRPWPPGSKGTRLTS